MPFNGSGSFSVTATFVPSTPISSSTMNTLLVDIATNGLSDCLTRDGQSTMTGQIKGANGTLSLPSYSFASDLNTGFYRIGSDNIGVVCGATKILDITTTGVALTGTFSVSGAVTFTTGIGTASIADDAVTFAKLLNATAGSKLIGSTAAGNFEELSLGTGLSLSGTSIIGTAVFPRNYIDGCIISNGTDATNDINIAVGVCRDGTNTANITIATAMGKQLDANWTAGGTTGTPAGMRNSAAGIANGTYHIYAVSKADGTQDIYAYAGVAGTDPDTAASLATVITALQAESGGADYLYARRIASIIRASATILAFKQDGEYFDLVTPTLDINRAAPGTSANTETLTVPLGIRVLALLNVEAATGQQLYVSSLSQTDQAPSTTASPLSTAYNAGGQGGGTARVRTNTSAQVRSRCSSSAQIYGATTGWQDTRGKDS